MFKKAMSGFLLLTAMIALNTVAFADNVPTLHQVYETVQAGKLDQAQKMMTVVLQAHPDSAKAHLVDAEILAKQGHMGQAKTELDTAKKIAPGLPFAKPAAIQDLQSRIAQGSSAQLTGSSAPTGTNHTSFPWGLVLFGLGAIAIVYFVIRAISSRNNTMMPTHYVSGGMPGASASPYGGGMSPMGGGMSPMGSGGMGSGIVSGLVTGAAVGAGMVAGEELAHHFLDGGQSGSASTDSWNSPSSDDNMGGTDFGVNDNGSWDDSSSVSDNSGFGGDDWG